MGLPYCCIYFAKLNESNKLNIDISVCDAVTHLPPELFGYFHIGTLLEIGTSGAYGAFEAHKSENIMAELVKYEEEHRMG